MAKKNEDKAMARDAADTLPRVSLKGLRKAANLTQEDLAAALDVGQDAISRLEKRSDMLMSTLRHYVESVGGQLALVAAFPDRGPVIIDLPGAKKAKKKHDAPKGRRSRSAAVHHPPQISESPA
ncbi:MAG TPA: helix-turn-helix transcriptional regulator [Rubrivivax sp.]|nr:helix-turn-helix transcriptional regulator [Rubrivivax sp.]